MRKYSMLRNWWNKSCSFILVLCFTIFLQAEASAADIEINSEQSFATLDASDGSSDGVFNVTGNLTITSTGSIIGPGGVNGIKIIITGNLDMASGARIVGDVSGAGLTGITINISAANIYLRGN